jgi:predicted nucleic acid-binding protein
VADSRRDQKYLAIDSNILIAYLDRDHPEHKRVRSLALKGVALNPTVIHEAYHALVFKMKWPSGQAGRVLREAMEDRNNLFLNQTRDTTRIGLTLADRYALEGRDALILASFLGPSVSNLLTSDKALVELKKVVYGRRELNVRLP